MEHFIYEPLISIIVPVYNTPGDFLARMIESARAQQYEKWELCLADGSTDGRAWPVIAAAMAAEPRIRGKQIENAGIAANTNAALSLATGEYIGFLDHDDLLTADALLEMVRALNEGERRADFAYSDEDKTDESGTRFYDANYKPDFGWESFHSANYICHFTILARSLWERVGFYIAEGYDGAQDYELFLRCAEQAECIKHVPKVLYHWRAHQASTAQTMDSKPYAYLAGERALAEHLERTGRKGRVLLHEVYYYGVEYELTARPLVSAVVRYHGERRQLARCLASFAKLGYDNYEVLLAEDGAAINELVKERAGGAYLLFLSDLTVPFTADWLQKLLRCAVQPGVAAVGGTIWHDGLVQSAGMIVGLGGSVGNAYEGLGPNDPGPLSRRIMVRNVSALSDKMVLVDRSDFLAAGGFDEEMEGPLGMADLCLRLREKGRDIVFLPFVGAEHEAFECPVFPRAAEEKFIKRWQGYSEPFYNKQLSLISGASYSLARAEQLKVIGSCGTYEPGRNRIAVQAHIFYVELAEEIIRYVNNIPEGFDCYVSTDSEEKARELQALFAKKCRAGFTEILVFPNRGRDVAPLLLQMGGRLWGYDGVVHIHSKKTTHASGWGDNWRHYLLEGLLGSPERIARVVELLRDGQTGLVYPPPYFELLEGNLSMTGDNIVILRQLLDNIGVPATDFTQMSFPAGGMLWFRPQAVKQLFDGYFNLDRFPAEKGQIDFTIMHAIERCWEFVAAANGYRRVYMSAE